MPATTVAKSSSVSTTVAASRATSVPPRPMATPMSAWRRAGASLTPSPVMATTSPWSCRVSAMRSFASGAVEQAGVGGDAVPFGQHDHVAGDQFADRYRPQHAAAADRGLWRQVAAEGFDRFARLVLLDEREDRVEHDDRADRQGELDGVGDDREAGGQDQQDRQRV